MSEPLETQDWPPLLRELAELLGAEVALRLGQECGGLDNIQIPQTVTANHLWRRVLDEAQFKKVVDHMGGQYVYLPRGTHTAMAKRLVLDLHEQGLSNRQIALRAHCSERYVRKVLSDIGAKAAPNERQLGLFGDGK